MLENVVHNTWLRWSYVLVIFALQLVLVSPYTLPSRERLYEALRNEISTYYGAEISALSDTTQYSDLKRSCLGDKMNRCVNDTMMRGRIDYQEGLYFKVLYANELSVSAVSHISHICKGVLFLINCHTTDIRN